MKPVVLCCAVLLACITTLAAPAVTMSSTTTVSGTIPLRLWEVAASSITCSGAVISWQTNGPSTSQVFYDTVGHDDLTQYASQVQCNDLVWMHSLSLSGLSSGTSYYCAVKSVLLDNGNSLIAVQNDFVFTTLTPGTALTITSPPDGKLPGGEVGLAYTYTLAACGGTPPCKWCVTGGCLPCGLILKASPGVISGTPTKAGNFRFSVRVTDTTGTTATAVLRIKIVAGSHMCTTSPHNSEANVWGTLLLKAECLASTCVNSILLPVLDW